jgi:hypothetical protein
MIRFDGPADPFRGLPSHLIALVGSVPVYSLVNPAVNQLRKSKIDQTHVLDPGDNRSGLVHAGLDSLGRLSHISRVLPEPFAVSGCATYLLSLASTLHTENQSSTKVPFDNEEKQKIRSRRLSW